MAKIQLLVPDIGDFDSVDVIEVLINDGDQIQLDDSVLTLESDKATMEVPATYAGKVSNLQVKVGDKVAKGSYICDLEVSDAAVAAPNDASTEQQTPTVAEIAAAPAAVEQAPTKLHEQTHASNVGLPIARSVSNTPKPVNHQSSGAVFHATPTVRAFARVLGVELTQVSGSGSKGRILKTDIEAFVKSVMQAGGAQATSGTVGSGIPVLPTIDFTQFGEVEEVELSRIKKISGKHLSTAWLNIPHVTQFDECDITSLEEFRKDMKAQAEKAGVKLTPLVFIMKAVVAGLKSFPNFNASLSPDGQKLLRKGYFNIGIAVDTPNGLVVPVVRDVDQKSIFELSRELMELSAKARDGKLSPKDLSGGCFSISSLGGIGGTQFTPIVNAPEVAIMGVSKAKIQPVWDGSSFQPRLIMPFSVSYDHRVIDGAEGVRFTQFIGQHLADIRQLLL
ncbi:dihydrolipoyllysine-residue acetyltransferase [Thiomicrospira cyclica]|uniref:Acetyltransferase component of pyruvate dehydrogenase complex n=1 Tax=Thiomicrospira cyclica (strain DSM 14477 / JCM 11371 / ALM1) TaxID=717773 RepID=F6DC86_THICA|nr:dihydrolipoyllysine-residue acetyltransferase [Thiomicrospira cyclica]AEG31472.1 Dihydrolipoyllysine-residue acetyltransferase [Thiomicrospira cyclica ALM1]